MLLSIDKIPAALLLGRLGQPRGGSFSVEVLPGKHDVVVNYIGIGDFVPPAGHFPGHLTYKTMGPTVLNFTAEAGKTYLLKGAENGDRVEVSIREITDEPKK